MSTNGVALRDLPNKVVVTGPDTINVLSGGPPGIQGPPGATGAQGIQGTAGIAGAQGPQGTPGAAIGGILTTVGDLAIHNGSTVTRLANGATGQVLTADPAGPNPKVKWATAAAASGALIRLPTTTADNTIIPTSVSVIPLTVKGIAGQTADLQQWQTSAGVVLGAVSELGTTTLGGVTRTKKRVFLTSTTDILSVGLHIQKAIGASSALDLFNDGMVAAQGGVNADGALLRFFDKHSDRGTGTLGDRGQEPATWIAQDGGYYTHKYVVISGVTTGGFDTWQMQMPSAENNMLYVWCDTPDAAVMLRPSSISTSYNIGCVDSISGNYRWTLDNDGKISWGDSATKVGMDVSLERDTSGWGGLATNQNLLLKNNKRILSQLAAGTIITLLTIDSVNAISIGDATVSYVQAMNRFRVFSAASVLMFDIDAVNIDMYLPARLMSNAVDVVPMTIKAFAAQIGDLTRWTDSSSVILSRFDKNGYFMTRKVAAPADGDLATSEVALWLDDTSGAANLKVKAKDSGGTVRTATIPLS